MEFSDDDEPSSNTTAKSESDAPVYKPEAGSSNWTVLKCLFDTNSGRSSFLRVRHINFIYPLPRQPAVARSAEQSCHEGVPAFQKG